MNSPIELKVVVSESYADKLREAIELDADACCGDAEALAEGQFWYSASVSGVKR